MKRIEWIDTAKGLLIVLVILGHIHSTHDSIWGGKDLIINSFHMAGFFILSGMTFSVKRPVMENIIHKMRTLLLPYFFFSLIYLVYQYLKSIVFGGPEFNFMSGLGSILIPISGLPTTSVYGLWFFPCLFIVEIALYIILKLKRHNSILFTSTLVLMAMVIHRFSGVVSIISIFPIALCFMAVGYYFRQKIDVFRLSWVSSITCLIVFIVALIINYSIHGYTFDLSSLTIGYWPLYVICGISGSILIYFIASRFSSIALFKTLGQDSMYYYGLHYCLIGVVEKIPYIGVVGRVILVIAILYPLIILWHRLKESTPNLKAK